MTCSRAYGHLGASTQDFENPGYIFTSHLAYAMYGWHPCKPLGIWEANSGWQFVVDDATQIPNGSRACHTEFGSRILSGLRLAKLPGCHPYAQWLVKMPSEFSEYCCDGNLNHGAVLPRGLQGCPQTAQIACEKATPMPRESLQYPWCEVIF